MWISFLVSFFTGTAASLGLGGGFILLVYLTAFAGVGQLEAQGINLIFFIPIALLSLILHKMNKLLCTKAVLPCIIAGVIGSVIGVLCAGFIGSKLLNKLFAVFIIIVGLKELFHKSDSKN